MRKIDMTKLVVLAAAAALLAVPAAARAAQAAPAATAGQPGPTDFAGVWELASIDLVVLPEVVGELTPEARKNADLFKQKFDPVIDDPAGVCLIKGMPWTMLVRARNYPTEIIQYPDRLFMVFELYDQFRNIRVGGSPKPDDYAPSPSGWSVAHWDGSSLVIETTGLTALNPIGPYARTEDARITERWSRRTDAEYGDVIDIEMSIEDPAIFAKPARARQVLKRSTPGIVPGGYNCSSALWDNHIDARKAALKISD